MVGNARVGDGCNGVWLNQPEEEDENTVRRCILCVWWNWRAAKPLFCVVFAPFGDDGVLIIEHALLFCFTNALNSERTEPFPCG